LPREAECAASDEHPTPPLLPRRPNRTATGIHLRKGIEGEGPSRHEQEWTLRAANRSYLSLRSGDRAEAAADPALPGLAVSESCVGWPCRAEASTLGWRAQCELESRANSA